MHGRKVDTVSAPDLRNDKMLATDCLKEFCRALLFSFHLTMNSKWYSNRNVSLRHRVSPVQDATCHHHRCMAHSMLPSLSGSGKTYTMKPLPLRAAEDMVQLLEMPQYQEQNFQLWMSFFEIYGGKVHDLLNDRW